MKTRYSVARCCCDKQVAPPPGEQFLDCGAWTESANIIPDGLWNIQLSYAPSQNPIGTGGGPSYGWQLDNLTATGLSNYSGYYLFADSLGIPQGATITSASLSTGSSGLISDMASPPPPPPGTARALIRGHLVPDAFSLGRQATSWTDYRDAPRTVSSVAWDVAAGQILGGNQFSTPDLSVVIQELVNQASWAPNNWIQLFFDDNGSDGDNGPTFDGWHMRIGNEDFGAVFPTFAATWV